MQQDGRSEFQTQRSPLIPRSAANSLGYSNLCTPTRIQVLRADFPAIGLFLGPDWMLMSIQQFGSPSAP